MPVEIGQDVDGKVTGITKYGAFIDLGEGKTGLVHISQISDSYVTDINQFIKVSDVVKVRVMSLVKPGKYDLSIKQAGKVYVPTYHKRPSQKEKAIPGSFEDKINRFLKDSEERLLDCKKNLEEKQGVRSRKK
ncbi:MAG: S1 RNA binding domain protein [Candidatus Saganbacteria bacterium]|uniref:S1 RNA binding domain protein n=1 Tax=Candidatus Saganbacteria bacterium TaxID=2575572 RepID=A0A833L1K7_UNCSA|nr:MAG: S1 RNA binding domain protein [Candidatus Saganbacteria bacterium]